MDKFKPAKCVFKKTFMILNLHQHNNFPKENCSICLRAKYVKKAKVVAILMMGRSEPTLHVDGIFSEFPKVAMVTLLSYFSQKKHENLESPLIF